MNEWINELINQTRVNRMIKKTRSQGKRLSENKLKTKQNMHVAILKWCRVLFSYCGWNCSQMIILKSLVSSHSLSLKAFVIKGIVHPPPQKPKFCHHLLNLMSFYPFYPLHFFIGTQKKMKKMQQVSYKA